MTARASRWQHHRPGAGGEIPGLQPVQLRIGAIGAGAFSPTWVGENSREPSHAAAGSARMWQGAGITEPVQMDVRDAEWRVRYSKLRLGLPTFWHTALSSRRTSSSGGRWAGGRPARRFACP